MSPTPTKVLQTCEADDSIIATVRSAVYAGLLDITVPEFEDELSMLGGDEREDYLQSLWDRL